MFISFLFALIDVQQMDISWIQGKQFTPSYIDGVREFMQFVKERFDETAEIRCPCHRCLNHITRPQSDVQDHIHIYGMLRHTLSGFIMENHLMLKSWKSQ